MSNDRLSLSDHRVKAAVAAAVLAVAVALVWLTPADEWFLAGVHWIRGQGLVGAALFVVLYVIGSVLMVPGSMLTLSGGFIYGVFWGTVLVSISSALGASAAFLIGRYIARDWVRSKVAHDKRFGSVDAAVGRQGFKIVLLARLSPVLPYILLNYFFGLTKVRFRDYVLATWIGMIPVLMLIVYLGTLFTSLTEVATGRVAPMENLSWLAGGFVLTVMFVSIIGRVAVKAWKDAVGGPT